MELRNFWSRLRTPYTEKAQGVLQLLNSTEDWHGEMYAPDMRERAPHLLGRITIYRLLMRMEEDGLIVSREEKDWEKICPDALPRRKYRLSAHEKRKLSG